MKNRFKLNNQGFAVSAIIYSVFALFLFIMIAFLSGLNNQYKVLKKTNENIKRKLIPSELIENNIPIEISIYQDYITSVDGKYAIIFRGMIGEIYLPKNTTITNFNNMMIIDIKNKEYEFSSISGNNNELKFFNTKNINVNSTSIFIRSITSSYSTTNLNYNTDGLILWYDGIYNNGLYNARSITTTIWKDLSGHANNAFLKGTTGTVNWTNSGLAFESAPLTDNLKHYITSKEFDLDGYTVEIVLTNLISGGGDILSIDSGTGTGMAFYSDTTYPKFYISSALNEPALAKSYVISVNKNKTANIYLDGILTVENIAIDYSTITKGFLSIGILRSSEDKRMRQTYTINVVRLYNRTLTSEEITNNYKIDKIRYGF